MKIKRRRIILKSLLCLALCLILGGGVILSAFPLKATAASTTYSNVLDDLKKDSSFNPDDYPAKADDYSLQVIQVAEGENGELFLYVYQPSDATKDLKASKINMSLQSPIEKESEHDLYSLTWLNSNGVFDKYIVNDFKVSDDLYRYYTITTIYRSFDSQIDDGALDSDDIVNYKGEEVAKSWCFSYYNDVLICESVSINVAVVTIQSIGFTKYFNGYQFFEGGKWVDSHFVAFSVDNYNVQYVKSAEITFYTEEYIAIGQGSDNLSYSYDESTLKPVKKKWTNEQVASIDSSGWFGKPYDWDRISTVSQFVKDTKNHTNIYSDAVYEEKLPDADFVIRFFETERYEAGTAMGQSLYAEEGVRVSEVALLSLSFVANNQTYNLGVVGDIVSDDGKADFTVTLADNIINSIEESEWWYKILAVLALILILVLISTLGGPIGWIIKIIFRGVKILLSWLFIILTLPFRAIKALLK